MAINTIQATKNYDKFTYLIGNRQIMAGHVAKLASSILKRNMLAQNPIIVNQKFEVIDGQHRLEVAKKNDLEVYYIVVNNAALDEIITLNSNNRTWDSRDYVNSYASQGNKHYVWLREFIDKYSLSVTYALVIIFGHEGSFTRSLIKTGKLTFTEKQKQDAENKADILWDIRPFSIRTGFMPKAFLMELVVAINDGLGKKFVKGLKEKGSTFTPARERKEAFSQIRLLMASQ